MLFRSEGDGIGDWNSPSENCPTCHGTAEIRKELAGALEVVNQWQLTSGVAGVVRESMIWKYGNREEVTSEKK